jgi:hypothetical protein
VNTEDPPVVYLTCWPGCGWLCVGAVCEKGTIDAFTNVKEAPQPFERVQPTLPFMRLWQDSTLEDA